MAHPRDDACEQGFAPELHQRFFATAHAARLTAREQKPCDVFSHAGRRRTAQRAASPSTSP
jgi:hypothetical protein